MFTVLPSLSTPLPSTATACATGDGLSIAIVTLPALALSLLLSNLSWPLGSALSFRLVDAPPPPPPDPLVLGAGAGVLEAVVSLEELELLELLSLPQPATAKAATAAQSAPADETFSFIGSSRGRVRLFLRTCPRRGSRRPSPARVLDLPGHDALA